MELRALGRTGVRVSELCLGAMTFGREADEATSTAMVDHFIEAGGNFVDTADVYSDGISEEITGRILKDKRDEIVLATKVRFPTGPGPNDLGSSRRHIRLGVEASLRRLGTEWIDLYQLHCWDARTPLEETISTLDDLVHEGKVRYVGASNYTAWQLTKALGIAALRGWEPFISLQPEYSLITRDIERELLPLCRSEGLAVLPWSPLAGGILTGKYEKDADLPQNTRGGDADEPITFTYRLDERAGRSSMRSRLPPSRSARRRHRLRSTGCSTDAVSPRRSSVRVTSSSSTPTSVRRVGSSRTSRAKHWHGPVPSPAATHTTSSSTPIRNRVRVSRLATLVRSR